MIVNCAYWYSLTVTVGLSNGASGYQMASFGNLLEQNLFGTPTWRVRVFNGYQTYQTLNT